MHQALGNLARLCLVILLLRPLHQAHHIAHAENTVGHAVGMEHVEGIHFLADTHKLDGLLHRVAYGQCRTATRVAVEFGQHHTVEVQPVVEGLGRVDGILTRHSVHHKKGLLRLQLAFQGRYLVHHLFIHRQTTGRIDNQHIDTLQLGLLDGVLGNLHGILRPLFGVHRHANLLAESLQLTDSGRTVHVASHQHHILGALGAQHIGQLGAESGLTRTLQAGDKHHRGLPLDVDIHRLRAHQLGQLLVHNLHHQLARFDALYHIATHSLRFHLVGKLLGDGITHIGVQQGLAHLLDGLRHIDIGNRPLASKGM